MTTRVLDQARFGAEDCAVSVIANFACNLCLAAPDLIILGGNPGARQATSVCPACGTVNKVTMTDDQAFQLWTLQRGNTFVHFPPELW